MTSRKTNIIVTIEQRQRLTIRRGRRTMGVWCDECSAESLLLSPTEAAAVLQIEVDEIFRQVQAGTAHVDVDREAGMRVCLKSLTQAL